MTRSRPARAASEHRRLLKDIDRVVRRGNCSGCGGCSLLSSSITMQLSSEGFLRPVADSSEGDPAKPLGPLSAVCPGLHLESPARSNIASHDVFGPYLFAWSAHATDAESRSRGSSGGVLTALSTWLADTGRVAASVGASMDTCSPTQTQSIEITTRSDALDAAGSRYAPVENLSTWRADSERALIAKPCEISAARSFLDSVATPGKEQPPLLSFFCAGTPSQRATGRLVEKLGFRTEEVESLRYRGNGWPGDFAVTTGDGRTATMSYRESWGGHLGRDVQWRCKLCVDGTGGDADLAVGDYWQTDADGYPDFTEREGSSVLIARTPLGLELALAAEADGVLFLTPIGLDSVSAVQPLQVERKRTLAGRLIGRMLAGKPGPSYRKYGILRALVMNPRANARAAIGTFLRSTGLRRRP